MGGIYHLVPTLIAVIVSLLIVRVGALALMMTGMSFETAKFQARSFVCARYREGQGVDSHAAYEQKADDGRLVGEARHCRKALWKDGL